MHLVQQPIPNPSEKKLNQVSRQEFAVVKHQAAEGAIQVKVRVMCCHHDR